MGSTESVEDIHENEGEAGGEEEVCELFGVWGISVGFGGVEGRERKGKRSIGEKTDDFVPQERELQYSHSILH